MGVTSGWTSESWWLKEDEEAIEAGGCLDACCSSMVEGALELGQVYGVASFPVQFWERFAVLEEVASRRSRLVQ